MVKVFIADDHAIVRRGLRQTIEETSDMEVVGEATNAQEVIDGVHTLKPDVVVLDITMPGRSGLDVLKEIRRLRPKTPVLILSMHSEEQYAVRSIKAGAAGYLTKEAIPEELVKAVRKIYKGGRHISPAVADVLADEIDRATPRDPHKMLSDREFEVMRLIASGKTVSEIAGELSLSAKTISTYRSRILRKMGMKNNSELTRYVIERTLLE